MEPFSPVFIAMRLCIRDFAISRGHGPDRSRGDGDAGASVASNTRQNDDNAGSTGDRRGNSRDFPADIPGPRKREIRLLLILLAPKRTVTLSPDRAKCIFSSLSFLS
jgi:hypothetical protein